MLQTKRMAALMTLAILGCYPLVPAHAQGIEPVKKDAAAPAQPAAKAGKGQKGAQPGQEAKKDPEAAARNLEAGIKAYESGKNEQAVGSITMALQNGGLPSQSVARALYYRGAAYRKQAKPAQAIADLKSALWLKGGLTEAERSDAVAQHAAAYKEAGLGEAPPVERTVAAAPASAPAAASTPSASPPAASAAAPLQVSMAASPATGAATPQMGLAPAETGTASAAAPVQTSSGGGVAGFFSNLFGGGSEPAPTAQAASAAPVTTASTRPAEPEVSSWSSTTSVKPAASAQAKVAAVEAAPAKPAAHAAPAASAKKASGKYRLEIGTTTSRDEAQSIAQRVKAEHGRDLASREPEIDEGTFGTSRYYRVGVGPYANAEEPGRLCAALKAKGVDCLVVTR